MQSRFREVYEPLACQNGESGREEPLPAQAHHGADRKDGKRVQTSTERGAKRQPSGSGTPGLAPSPRSSSPASVTSNQISRALRRSHVS